MEVPSQAFLPCLKQEEPSLPTGNTSDHANITEPFSLPSDYDESAEIAKLLLHEETAESVFTVRAHENDCMKLKVSTKLGFYKFTLACRWPFGPTA